MSVKNHTSEKLEDITKVIENPKNPNKHSDAQINMLAKIIEFQGWRIPIVVSNRSGFIVRGHGRLMSAKKLGLNQVPVSYQDYESEAQEWADLVADNRIAELAEMDRSDLKDIIEQLDTGEIDLDLTGFDQDSIEELMSEFFEPEDGLTGDDEIPEEVESRCKIGDLWQLGNHRLICGDSSDSNNIEILMGDNLADISFTSPPYNVGGNAKGGHLKISDNYSKYISVNDDMKSTDYIKLIDAMIETSIRKSDFSFVNIQMLGANKITIIDWLQKWKHHFADVAIWNKEHGAPAMGDSVMNSAFEFIFIFAKKVNPSKRIGKKKFRGNLQNVYTAPKQMSNEFSKVHGATFPAHLPEWILSNFTNEKESCIDLFGGTGTTMIACEKMNRVCYMSEIGEKYCDIIIQRWEDFTGKKAEKIN